MTSQMIDFLSDLAELLDEYSAELGYTNDDDGVHVSIGKEDVSIGWPMMPYPGDDIMIKIPNNKLIRRNHETDGKT